MGAPPAGEYILWRGRRVCQCVIDAVNEYEKVNKASLPAGEIFQGGYNKGGVPASKGTHDRGGCIDAVPLSAQRTLSARTIGFWPCNRTRAQGFSGNHTHWILFGCPHRPELTVWQETELRAGRNALARRERDSDPRPSKVRTFRQYMADTYAAAGPLIVIGGTRYRDVPSVSVARINWSRQYPTRVVVDTYVLQVWLRRSGYYLSTLDGKFGPVTQAALDNYRRRVLKYRMAGASGAIGLTSLTALRDAYRSKRKVAA